MDRGLSWFVRIWIGLVLLLNVAGVAGIFFTAETFWAGVGQVQDVYSPFNLWTHGLNIALISPAIGAYFWRECRRKIALQAHVSPSPAIERAIRAEQEKLEENDRRKNDFDERLRERFQPLRVLLDELAASIEPEHLNAIRGEASVTIEVTKTWYERDLQWSIKPNFKGSSFYGQLQEMLPGFKVIERDYRLHEDADDEFHIFDNEEEVMAFLEEKISERIAFYRHLKAKG